MGELNEASSFLKIVEEEIKSGEVKQKSRLQILNDLSIKWGAKDNVESFEGFIHTYSINAVITLVHQAMNEIFLQGIKSHKNPKSNDYTDFANWIQEKEYSKRKHTHPNKVGKWFSNYTDSGFLSDDELFSEYQKDEEWKLRKK